MTELIMAMIACLITAIILGFIIGWLFLKTILKKRHFTEVTALNTQLLEAKIELEEYQRSCKNEQKKIEKTILKNRELIAMLEDKSMLLDSKSQELFRVKKELDLSQSSLNKTSDTKKHNHTLVKRIMTLERSVDKKSKESRGLETVLLRADKIIEERNEIIKILEEKLKLYQEKTLIDEEKEEELLISKDQFTHIENQLLVYQDEISKLKKKNKILTEHKRELLSLEAKEGDKELDDLAIVKLFGDTYKKIIKS